VVIDGLSSWKAPGDLRACPHEPGRATTLACESGIVRKSPPHPRIAFMDIEHINSIGNMLADLSERTASLRRYL